ncbi:MAG: T9SS type A sorting domain-containing protein [Bacteroidales bacterium]
MINAVFNNGSWDAEGKDFDTAMNCIDFTIPFHINAIGDHPEVTFKLYPNPVENMLTVEDIEGAEKIEVYNVVGKLVKTIDRISTPVVKINTADLTQEFIF